MDAVLDVPPALGSLLVDDPQWRYPARDCAGGSGVARLRVWAAARPHAGHVVVVTELGIGVSVTNAIADIAAAVSAQFTGPIYLVEHWPAAQGACGEEHLDLAAVHGRNPEWVRLWPTAAAHPHHAAANAWMADHGPTVLDGPAMRGHSPR